jgi:hypothetical protein
MYQRSPCMFVYYESSIIQFLFVILVQVLKLSFLPTVKGNESSVISWNEMISQDWGNASNMSARVPIIMKAITFQTIESTTQRVDGDGSNSSPHRYWTLFEAITTKVFHVLPQLKE